MSMAKESPAMRTARFASRIAPHTIAARRESHQERLMQGNPPRVPSAIGCASVWLVSLVRC